MSSRRWSRPVTPTASPQPSSPSTASFNHTTGRIKLAWFLLHVARYMPPLIYAADPQWGAEAVESHRQLIAALRRRDIAEVVRLTDWQFTDGARRLTARLEETGIWN